MLGDDGMGLRRGDVHDKGEGVEPGLQGAGTQRVTRQRLLHALAVFAAAPKLVQVRVLAVTDAMFSGRNAGSAAQLPHINPLQACAAYVRLATVRT